MSLRLATVHENVRSTLARPRNYGMENGRQRARLQSGGPRRGEIAQGWGPEGRRHKAISSRHRGNDKCLERDPISNDTSAPSAGTGNLQKPIALHYVDDKKVVSSVAPRSWVSGSSFEKSDRPESWRSTLRCPDPRDVKNGATSGDMYENKRRATKCTVINPAFYTKLHRLSNN